MTYGGRAEKTSVRVGMLEHNLHEADGQQDTIRCSDCENHIRPR